MPRSVPILATALPRATAQYFVLRHTRDGVSEWPEPYPGLEPNTISYETLKLT